MSKYYIGLRSKTHLNDTLVVEREDLTALRTELACFVGELLADHAEVIWKDEDWRVDVADEAGLIMFVIEIQARDTAASMPSRQPA